MSRNKNRAPGPEHSGADEPASFEQLTTLNDIAVNIWASIKHFPGRTNVKGYNSHFDSHDETAVIEVKDGARTAGVKINQGLGGSWTMTNYLTYREAGAPQGVTRVVEERYPITSGVPGMHSEAIYETDYEGKIDRLVEFIGEKPEPPLTSEQCDSAIRQLERFRDPSMQPA